MLSKPRKGIKKVVLLCRKKSALECVAFLVKNKIEIAAIVTHPADPAVLDLKKFARQEKILFFTDDAPLYKLIERRDKRVQNVDLVISYLFWKKIRKPLIELGLKGCINLHPAPLPDYKSRAGYNTAILDQRKSRLQQVLPLITMRPPKTMHYAVQFNAVQTAPCVQPLKSLTVIDQGLCFVGCNQIPGH
jgi:hypothetical protein